MRKAIDETERRREKQHQYNLDNNITPRGVTSKITDVMDVGSSSSNKNQLSEVAEAQAAYALLSTREIDKKVKQLEEEMYKHAQNLEFEAAAAIRDDIAMLH